jgi:HPt (histidine-containing phosphotransfer) domain-containing protein
MSSDALASVPAVDRAVLGEWLNSDAAAIDALLRLFYASICADAENMRSLLAADEFDQFANAAHRVRGAALSMGARALADFVGLLFTAALARDRSACVDRMPMLATHVQRVAAEVPADASSTGN